MGLNERNANQPDIASLYCFMVVWPLILKAPKNAQTSKTSNFSSTVLSSTANWSQPMTTNVLSAERAEAIRLAYYTRNQRVL